MEYDNIKLGKFEKNQDEVYLMSFDPVTIFGHQNIFGHVSQGKSLKECSM